MAYPEKPVRRATRHWPDLGGMKRVVANFLCDLVGARDYIIGVLPHPRTPEELEVALQWAANPANNHVYVDKEDIVYVNYVGVDGWLEPFTAAGISVTMNKNHGKYSKQTYRPTTTGLQLPDDMDITVRIMETDEVRAFSSEDLSSYSDDEVEMILDGMFVLSKDIWDMLVASTEGNKDPFKSHRRHQKVRNVREMNVRLWTELGFIKGNAICAHGDLPGGVMVLTSRANVKSAISVTNGGKRFIIAEPDGGKNEAYSNIQLLAWFHAVNAGTTQLLTQDMLQRVLDDHLEKSYQQVINGELTERFSDVDSFVWQQMKSLGIPGNTVMNRWSVVEAAARGFDYRTSPAMLKTVATNNRTSMVDANGHPRFPLPNAHFKTVKSVSMLRLAGYKVKTPTKGFIEYHPGTDTWFLCDSDWIDHSVDFGGHDGDDHFTIMSVQDSHGKHRILVWRMPMDSYAMFRTSQKGISHVDSKGTETFAFQMSAKSNLDTMPKPLGRLISEGHVTFTGLPSQSKTPRYSGQSLTREDVMDQIRGLSGQNAALGAYVNSLFLYRWVFKTLPSTMPGMLSDVVDSSDPDDVQYVLNYSANLVREVLDSGRPISRAYWHTTRAFGFEKVLNEYREDHPDFQPNFVDNDKLSMMTRSMGNAIEKYDRKIYDFGQKNHALVDPSIRALFKNGDPELVMARKLVRDFRLRFPKETARRGEEHQQAVKDWLESEGPKGPKPIEPKSFSSEAWVRIRSGIMDGYEYLDKDGNVIDSCQGITSFEGDERHRLVLALYVMAHSMPLSSKKAMNDNFITSSQADNGEDVGPFRFLMDALAAYGYIASDLVIDDIGSARLIYEDRKTWHLTCRSCNTTYYVAKREQLESFRANDKTCKNCR
jgi:hypothetical protein